MTSFIVAIWGALTISAPRPLKVFDPRWFHCAFHRFGMHVKRAGLPPEQRPFSAGTTFATGNHAIPALSVRLVRSIEEGETHAPAGAATTKVAIIATL